MAPEKARLFYNTNMRLCLIHFGLFCLLGGAVSASGVDEARKVASVIRVDRKTGKLVRGTVVTPVVVTPKAVDPAAEARAGSKTQAAARPARFQSASADHLPLSDLVEKTARKYDVDPLLVHAVIQVESGYNPVAISPAGARGLMQLIPSTARRFGVSNVFRVSDNLDGGVRYLRYLLDLFRDDRLAIAAYNAGEAAVMKYNFTIPPYPETINYVYQVGKRWGEARLRERQRQAAETAAAQRQAAQRSEPAYRPVESFVDSNGRLHLKTR
jgi:hypothetical protein